MSKVERKGDHKAWWSYAFNTYLRGKRGNNSFYTCNLCITESTVYWCCSSWIARMISISSWGRTNDLEITETLSDRIQIKWFRSLTRTQPPCAERYLSWAQVFLLKQKHAPACLYDNIPHVNKKLLNYILFSVFNCLYWWTRQHSTNHLSLTLWFESYS